MPLTWILIALFYAIFTRHQARRKKALIAATVLLVFFTNSFISNEAWLAWEYPPTPIHKLQRYDAAIILTGITNQDKSPHDRVYLQKGADRVMLPLRLYKEGYVKKLIISGGSGSLTKKTSNEAAQLKQLLLYSGVSADAILTEEKSRNTYENAMYTKALLQQHPELKRLLLVTSAFHMRRAWGCFQKQGITTEGFSTDFYSSDRSFYIDQLLIPQELNLHHWQKLFHEIIGFAVYKLMGYC